MTPINWTTTEQTYEQWDAQLDNVHLTISRGIGETLYAWHVRLDAPVASWRIDYTLRQDFATAKHLAEAAARDLLSLRS